MAFGKMVIDVTEISKNKFYQIRNDRANVVVEKPNGYVHRRVEDKVSHLDLYLTKDGKFYVGELETYSTHDFVNMTLREVRVTFTAIFDDPKWEQGKPEPVTAA